MKKKPKLGQRCKVLSLGIKGTINYIDWPSFCFPHMYPIQVILDRPYEDDHRMYRTSRSDLKLLKKKGSLTFEQFTEDVKKLKKPEDMLAYLWTIIDKS